MKHPVNLIVLLCLAWVAFIAKYGVGYVVARRAATGTLVALAPLPAPTTLRARSAAYAGRPVMHPARSSAAQRRLNTLIVLVLATLVSGLVTITSGGRPATGALAVSLLALLAFVRALRARTVVRRAQIIEKLWARDRYDDLGHARVMSLEEARRRATSIADPLYVPARRRIS